MEVPRRIIAVEQGLDPFKKYLEERGLRVVDLQGDDLRRADAVIVSGMDKNFAASQAIETEAPVLVASGRTPEEVYREILRRLP
ncbi:MAG TPA: YkuS family protein [Clostridia bacterium]|nr:YkuS family protein [Clostridia bacterium]